MVDFILNENTNMRFIATADLDFGTISINIPVSIEAGTNYVKDAEDNNIGISDYWIDDGKAYLLSSTYNKIYVYQNGERIDAIDLNQYGITTILFAVNENQTWIYDNKGRIIVYIYWSICITIKAKFRCGGC